MQKKRSDIQGLRALAVLLVVADHVLGWPRGGFIGVDVFFVVSGYLISGHLLRERERDGGISLRQFYVRRAKRILPASLTVTVIVVVCGYLVFTMARASSVLTDAVWATLFAANWHFIAVGADYMQSGFATSPFQHYWSLSIEEQFYWVWPLLIAVVFIVAIRRGRSPRSVALATSLAVVIISAGWAVVETSMNPSAAYFSTIGRVGELAAGAVLAIVEPRSSLFDSRIMPWLSWLGLTLIGGSAVLLNSESPFPGPWAIVPVLGTLFVIVAGSAPPRRANWLLGNRVAGYVGDISYSVYLWHWPIYIFALTIAWGHPKRVIIATLILTAMFSMLSYHFVETPVRRVSSWRGIRRTTFSAVGVLACAATIAVFVPRSVPAVTLVERTYANDAIGALERSVDGALETTSWPRLSPDVTTLGRGNMVPEWVEDGCLAGETKALADPYANAGRCTYGDGSKSAVLMGDSVAISWMPALRRALVGYRIQVYAMARCPAVPVKVVEGTVDSVQCDQFRRWAVREIVRAHPQLVVVSDASGELNPATPASAKDWEQKARGLYEELGRSAETVVVLQPPPSSRGFDACAGPGTTPASCLLVLPPAYWYMRQADMKAAASTGVRFVDTRAWFCNAKNFCPSFVGTTPVLVDNAHLTRDFSAQLAPVMAYTLKH